MKKWRFRESDNPVTVAAKKAMNCAPSCSGRIPTSDGVPDGFATLDDYCDAKGIRIKAKRRALATNVLARLSAGLVGRPVRLEHPSRGHVLAYPMEALERWHASRA